MIKRKFVTILLAALALFLSQTADSYAISWNSNLRSSLKKAKRKGTPVMLYFYTNWCSWCEKMERETLSDREVSNLARKLICVKINGDRDKETVKEYNVTGYPTVIFLASSGSMIRNMGGYQEPADFAKVMERIASIPKLPLLEKSVRGTGEG